MFLINRKDLKRVWLALMVLMLTMSAPQWLNPANKKVSSYDAPWIYPGLEPSER